MVDSNVKDNVEPNSKGIGIAKGKLGAYSAYSIERVKC